MARKRKSHTATFKAQVALAAVKGDKTVSELAGAIAAVALGWPHADVGGHGSASAGHLALHRWLGTTAGLWAASITLLSERDCHRGQRSLFFRVILWTGTSVVAAAAHFGGLMVHGNRFFNL